MVDLEIEAILDENGGSNFETCHIVSYYFCRKTICFSIRYQLDGV